MRRKIPTRNRITVADLQVMTESLRVLAVVLSHSTYNREAESHVKVSCDMEATKK